MGKLELIIDSRSADTHLQDIFKQGKATEIASAHNETFGLRIPVGNILPVKSQNMLVYNIMNIKIEQPFPQS